MPRLSSMFVLVVRWVDLGLGRLGLESAFHSLFSSFSAVEGALCPFGGPVLQKDSTPPVEEATFNILAGTLSSLVNREMIFYNLMT